MNTEFDECLNGQLISYHNLGLLTDKEKELLLNNLVFFDNYNTMVYAIGDTGRYFDWLEKHDLVVEFATFVNDVGKNNVYSSYVEFKRMTANRSLIDFLGAIIRDFGRLLVKYYSGDLKKRLLENVVTEKDKKKESPESITFENNLKYLTEQYVLILRSFCSLEEMVNVKIKNFEFSCNELNEKLYKAELRIDTMMKSIDVLLVTQQTILNITERLVKNG